MIIQGRRTYRGLHGHRCIPLEYDWPDKEAISTARSFGTMETEPAPIEEALATYVANAALKLRAQNSVCAKMFVFCHTSRFAVVKDLYSAGLDIQIDILTNDTAKLIKEAIAHFEKFTEKVHVTRK